MDHPADPLISELRSVEALLRGHLVLPQLAVIGHHGCDQGQAHHQQRQVDLAGRDELEAVGAAAGWADPQPDPVLAVEALADALDGVTAEGVSLLDINEDGWPDLYVTNDYLTNDHLYVNNGNGTFSEQVSAYFRHTSHFAMGNDVGDVNNDGLMDVMAVDMLPEDHARRKLMFGATQYNKFYYAVTHGYTHQYMRNTLQLNNGNGSFSEIGQLAGVYQTDWSWARPFSPPSPS